MKPDDLRPHTPVCRTLLSPAATSYFSIVLIVGWRHFLALLAPSVALRFSLKLQPARLSPVLPISEERPPCGRAARRGRTDGRTNDHLDREEIITRLVPPAPSSQMGLRYSWAYPSRCDLKGGPTRGRPGQFSDRRRVPTPRAEPHKRDRPRDGRTGQLPPRDCHRLLHAGEELAGRRRIQIFGAYSSLYKKETHTGRHSAQNVWISSRERTFLREGTDVKDDCAPMQQGCAVGYYDHDRSTITIQVLDRSSIDWWIVGYSLLLVG